MDNFLLIGGAGYVGSVLTKYLLDKKKKVQVIDNFIYKNNFSIKQFLKNSKYKFINGDYSDINVINNLKSDIDHVIFLGGLVGDPITNKYPELADKINDSGIINCINSLEKKKIKNLIFISTCSNYGLIKDTEKASETFELKPLSLYAKSKVRIEKFLLNKKNKVDYNVTILRFATAFGLSPRMRFDLTVNEFTKELMLNNDLEIFDADTWRPYCHVIDFSRLIYSVVTAEISTKYFEVFNVGSDENNYTKRQIVNKLINYFPKSKIIYRQKGSLDKRNYKVDFSKVKKNLNFNAKYNLDYGIEEIIEFLKNSNLDYLVKNKKKFGNYEIDNCL